MSDREKTVLDPVDASHRITPFGVVLRAASFIVAWWAFTEGSWKEWGLGVVVVIAAALASFHILPLRSWRWSLWGLTLFVPYFLWQSLLGSIDVSLRAISPRMPLNPYLRTYKTILPANLPRVFMVWTISLLPGTASVDIQGDQLTIHVLNDDDLFTERMQHLERRIAKIFGVRVSP